MHRYRITINNRVYEGWYKTVANAVFGALRKDEPNRPNNPGRVIAPAEDTDVDIHIDWLEYDPDRRSTGVKLMG